jgi:hypothetical protein
MVVDGYPWSGVREVGEEREELEVKEEQQVQVCSSAREESKRKTLLHQIWVVMVEMRAKAQVSDGFSLAPHC